MTMTVRAAIGLLLVINCICSITCTSESLLEDAQIHSSSTSDRELIVRGQDAAPGRYPYLVSLRENTSVPHQCGGAVIAPDIILTAAHCVKIAKVAEIGRYNIDDSTEDYETFVFEEAVSHPRYYENIPSDVDEYDYLLLKLYDKTSYPSIRLNRDPIIPLLEGEELYVMGWGVTSLSGPLELSPIMQEAEVFYIPNEQCADIESTVSDGTILDLSTEVHGITLCAGDFVELDDACQGDSGGPIVLRGNDPSQDFHLGVTSYGFVGCGHPELPGIYARTSYVDKWIKEHVCRMSLYPPEDFECPARKASVEPDFSGDLAAVTIEIVFGALPSSTGWIIRSPNDDNALVTYHHEPIGTYRNDGTDMVVSKVLSLPNNRAYVFTLFDAYVLARARFLISDAAGQTLASADGTSFDYATSFDFVLGTLPTPSPTISPAPTMTSMPTSPPTGTRPFVTIVIDFDNFSVDTGWILEALDSGNGEPLLIKQVYPGTYEGQTRMTETVDLLSSGPESTPYRFTITDNEMDGLCTDKFKFGCGSYQLWFGAAEDGICLAQGSDFVWEVAHEFVVDSNGNLVDPNKSRCGQGDPSSGYRHSGTTFYCTLFVCLLIVFPLIIS